MMSVIPTQSYLVSAVLTIDQTTKVSDVPIRVSLSLRYGLFHFTHSVPKLLRNDRLVRILHNDHVLLIVLDDLMILIADRSCAELNKMSEVGVVVKYLPDSFGAPHMSCSTRIRLAELYVVVI